MGEGDEWPGIRDRVLEDEDLGFEDGAHHVISEVSGALEDIGFTIPGQAWTYWNRGRAPDGAEVALLNR